MKMMYILNTVLVAVEKRRVELAERIGVGNWFVKSAIGLVIRTANVVGKELVRRERDRGRNKSLDKCECWYCIVISLLVCGGICFCLYIVY